MTDSCLVVLWFYFFDAAGVSPQPQPSLIEENWSTNRRAFSEWYVCGRCGMQYPRSRVKVQNGLTVCDGAGTLNCADKPGHAAYYADTAAGYERIPEELPSENVDL